MERWKDDTSATLALPHSRIFAFWNPWQRVFAIQITLHNKLAYTKRKRVWRPLPTSLCTFSDLVGAKPQIHDPGGRVLAYFHPSSLLPLQLPGVWKYCTTCHPTLSHWAVAACIGFASGFPFQGHSDQEIPRSIHSTNRKWTIGKERSSVVMAILPFCIDWCVVLLPSYTLGVTFHWYCVQYFWIVIWARRGGLAGYVWEWLTCDDSGVFLNKRRSQLTPLGSFCISISSRF
jgi:hypothetical protein